MTTLIEPLDCECEEEEFEPRPYKDLPPDVQAMAIENYREMRWSSGHDDGVSDTLHSDLSDYYGLSDCKLYYSLGSCQGDGVAFEGSPDIDQWADCAAMNQHDRELLSLLAELRAFAALFGMEETPMPSVKITHFGRYYHWNSMEVTVEDSTAYDARRNDEIAVEQEHCLDRIVTAIQDYCTQDVKDISRALERDGYSQIEANDADDAIVEEIEANDYLFDEEGEIA